MAFLPTYSLLMPKSGDDAKEGYKHANGAQYGLAMASHRATSGSAVLYAIEWVNVNAYVHPHDKTYPCFGRKEEHHAYAAH